MWVLVRKLPAQEPQMFQQIFTEAEEAMLSAEADAASLGLLFGPWQNAPMRMAECPDGTFYSVQQHEGQKIDDVELG